MTNIKSSYIDSVIQKLRFLFLGNTIDFFYRVFDEDKDELDEVIFLDSSKGHIGIFIDGANPLFTDKNVNEFDSFNLFARYNEINLKKNINLSLNSINSITITLGKKYNEVFSFYLKDSANNMVAFIFKHSSITSFSIHSEDEYSDILGRHLKHLNKNDFTHISINKEA